MIAMVIIQTGDTAGKRGGDGMDIKEHPVFKPPADEKTKIWRYMDLSKFLSILDKAALYFVSLEKLDAIDPFEGCYPNLPANIENLNFDAVSDEWKKSNNINTKEKLEGYIHNIKVIRDFLKISRPATYVNSWHAQEYESDAMWKLYLASSDGICIQSTYQRLKNSLKGYCGYSINIGMVEYKDYDNDMIPYQNIMSPSMTKRISFEHEKELRALIWTLESNDSPLPGKTVTIKVKQMDGLYVPVDLDLLIERIYIAPTAPDWIFELIKNLVVKFGLEKDVTRSSLDVAPDYL